MKKQNSFIPMVIIAILFTLLAAAINVKAQQARYKMTTDIPASITTPDVVETSLGTLRFFDGFPDDASLEKLYDNLDFQRAVQSYLLGLPAVNMLALGKGLTSLGPANNTIVTWEKRVDARALVLTANCNSPYSAIWLDLQNGPLVLEVPPMVLGIINDLWSRYVSDIGLVGPDRGKGGKYLILPPGYKGTIPEGFIVVQSSTFNNLCFFRLFEVEGDFQPAITSMKKNTHVYPLAQADQSPVNEFIDISGLDFISVGPADFGFWEYLNEVVQAEPTQSFDRVSLGFFASIGIEKGKRFAPDDRMRKILNDAPVVGNATARAISYKIRQKENFFYENSAWRGLFLGGYQFETTQGVLNLDGYVNFYFPYYGISPAEDLKMIGKGSQYITAFTDVAGGMLDGSKNYTLHIPANIPAKDFWSVILYDYQTRSLLQTDQPFPMVSSQNKDLMVNPDGSADVYFGPEVPEGKQNNWIQTIPGKGWFAMFRLYGPLESWFDKSWQPGEIEIVR